MAVESPPVPRRICVIRLSSIGDVTNAVAAVQAIQRHLPETRITWIVGRVEADLVGDLPGVECVVYDKARGFRGLAEARRRLRGRRFDVLLHMQVSLRASLVSLLVRADARIGFDRARAAEGQWLFTNRSVAPQAHAHVLEGFMAFAAALGVPESPPSWDIPVPPGDREWAETVLPPGAPVFAIVPAASAPQRDWTAEGYAAVAAHAMDQGFRVALLGGDSTRERALGDGIGAALGQPVIDLIGRTTLKRLLALLDRTALLLAPDTGPVHMAVARRVPVIGLYCHSNPRRTGPFACRDYVVNHYDDLFRRQYGVGWEERPWGTRVRGRGLMREIPVAEVLAMFDRVVAERRIAG